MIRIALVLLAFCAPVLPQPATVKSGRIEGQLVDAKTSQGIRKGWLTLRSADASAAGYTTVSDANGNFVFEDVDPGRYTLSAEQAAYLRGNNPGGQITVGAGDTFKTGRFPLTPQGVISGRVLDEGGDPLPGSVQVQVSRWRWDTQTGVRTLTQIKQTSADDQGAFRLSGLAAGRYYLSAYGGRTTPAFDDRTVMGGAEAYTTTYYPGATGPEGATAIAIEAGGEIANVDLHLRRVRVSRIRGTARDISSAEPVNQIALHLVPQGAYPISPLTNDAVAVVQKGVFEFPRAIAGSYTILAPDNAGAGHMVGRYDLAVAEGDIGGIQLLLSPGAAVEGHFKMDSGEPVPSGGGFSLRSADGAGLNIPAKIEGATDPTPRLAGIPPGRYWVDVRVDARSSNLYVKSIHFGEVDASLKPIDIGSGAQPALDVLVSAHGGAVAGTVRNEKGDSAAAAQVVLAPASKDLGGVQRLVKGVAAGQGAFRFTGVAPGHYLVLALEGGEAGALRDAAFREAIADQGVKVTVREGSMITLDVPLISESALADALAKFE